MSQKRRTLQDVQSFEPNKKIHNFIENLHSSSSVTQHIQKSPSFISYRDVKNLHPKIRFLCQILAETPSSNIENALNESDIRISKDLVEQVLKFSYSYPASAAKFFRWAGEHLGDEHSPYAWNLVVDILGKNFLFDAMWDAIRSMKSEGLLSLATFASVFGSYAIADRIDDAIMSFNVMEQYDCICDTVALNSLLSAICGEGKTQRACEFVNEIKDKIRTDSDTFAILLEGWEKEKNVAGAKKTFEVMGIVVGWDPANVPAYDSFLNTLMKGSGGIKEAMDFFNILRDKRCFPGLKFFRNALEDLCKVSDLDNALSLWDVMMRKKLCRPDTQMYNSMIELECCRSHFDEALKFLDEMVFDGAFPDSQTYNVIFQFLIKGKRLQEASSIFNEMVKNECPPNLANCNLALDAYLDAGDGEIAIKIWKTMMRFKISSLEEGGNFLVLGLRDINMLPEALKYAEDMIGMGIKLNSSTMSKLKSSLSKIGKGAVYEDLLMKWKLHSDGNTM